MAVTLIHDPRSNVTSIVQYTKTEDGKKKAKTIGSIGSDLRKRKRYIREETVEKNRKENAKWKGDEDCDDLVQSPTVGYISAMFADLWDNVLNRHYDALIGGYSILRLSEDKKHDVCEQYGLTSEDLKKIAVELARLEDDWWQSLQQVLANGFRYRDAWTSEEHRYTVKDLTQRLSRLAK